MSDMSKDVHAPEENAYLDGEVFFDEILSSEIDTNSSPCLISHKASQPILTSDLVDSIVDIYVDPGQFKDGVHRGLLCHHSALFKAALENVPGQPRTTKMMLPEVDTITFAQFKLWMYTGSFNADTNDITDWSQLFDLYIFAEAWAITSLRNQTMDYMLDLVSNRQLCKDGAFEAEAKETWQQSSKASPLRNLIVDFFQEISVLVEEFDRYLNIYPLELVAAVAIRGQNLRRFPNQLSFLERLECGKSRCERYHVHKAREVMDDSDSEDE